MIKVWPYLTALLFFLNVPALNAETLALTSWVLPLTINDDNTEVHYEYHALGREKSGRSQGVRGKVWLATSDIRSVKAQITVPAPALDSLASDFMGAFGELLKTAQLPAIIVSIDRLTNLCLPKDILPGKDCFANMEGRAQFGSLSRDLSLPVRIQRKRDVFVVHGEGDLDTGAVSKTVALENVIESATFSFTISLPS